MAGGNWEYGTFSLYAFDIIIAVLFVLSIFSSDKSRKTAGNFWVLIIGFFIICFTSIFSAINKELAWYAAMRLAEGMMLLWIILRTSFSWQKISLAMVAGGVIQAGLGIYQFFSQVSPAFKWLGLTKHTPLDSNGVSVIATIDGRWLRAYGSLPHPNILGGYLVVCLLVLMGLIIYLHRRKLVRWWKVIIYTTVFCLMFLGLVFTFSRSAWLAFGISFIGLIVFSIWQREKRLQFILFRISLWILLLSAATILMLPYLWQTRLTGNSELETRSTTERLDYFKQATGLISEDWLSGVGVGNYTQAVYQQDSSQKVGDYQPVHNIYMLVITETGVFGGLVFVLIIAEFLGATYLMIKKKKKELTETCLVITGAFISLLIIGLFDHYLWTLSFGILLFWLILGLWLKNWSENKESGLFGTMLDKIPGNSP